MTETRGMGFVNFGNDGTVGPTGVFDTGLIGVHDFEVSGLARQFTLVLQPNTTFTQPPILTPEPSTLSLLLVLAGVVALIWVALTTVTNVAALPPIFTEVAPLKLVPVIWTWVPPAVLPPLAMLPPLGLIAVTVGGVCVT